MKRKAQGWGAANEQPQQHYLVEPRHLAGTGDVRYLTEYLRIVGWKNRSKAGGPLVLTSPDRNIRLGFDPYANPAGWSVSSRATKTQPAWQATLTTHVPVEIIAGLTDALAQPQARTAHAPNVWEPLAAQNWSTAQGKHFTATSPDQTAMVQYHQSGPDTAHWWAAARTEHGQVWDVIFSQHTPMHLVQSFTASLAAPYPLMRPRGAVPATDRIRTRSVSVLPSELSRFQQARLASARAASWARNSWVRRDPAYAQPPRTYASAGTGGQRR
ncbi:DUF317 domain-containing protein [Streptomyces sp. NPDC051561]|uniref:DUF317 domain-containing protein n=1 Tax=Streptomyces sp. NPDC051561 TaxID=3365658 RepID=UPI0037AA2C0D